MPFPGLDPATSTHSGLSDQQSEDLVYLAAVGDKPRSLPVVSIDSLRQAFNASPHAVAVVRVKRDTGSPRRFAELCEESSTMNVHLSVHRRSTRCNTAHSMHSMHSHPSLVFGNGSTQSHGPFVGSGVHSAASNHESVHSLGSPIGNKQHSQAVWDDALSETKNEEDELKQSDTATCSLDPVYLNKALLRMLEIRSMQDYNWLMEKQLLRNPMLVMLFENSIMRLMEGKATTVRQYLPYFHSPGSKCSNADYTNFMNLQITACGFMEPNQTISPALFLWYNATSSPQELSSLLKRDYMALSHIPSMVTVFTLDGKVLHQNGRSVAYMGFVMASRGQGTDMSNPEHKLRRLFCADESKLQEMWAAVMDGRVWTGVVKMLPILDLTEEHTHRRSRRLSVRSVPSSCYSLTSEPTTPPSAAQLNAVGKQPPSLFAAAAALAAVAEAASAEAAELAAEEEAAEDESEAKGSGVSPQRPAALNGIVGSAPPLPRLSRGRQRRSSLDSLTLSADTSRRSSVEPGRRRKSMDLGVVARRGRKPPKRQNSESVRQIRSAMGSSTGMPSQRVSLVSSANALPASSTQLPEVAPQNRGLLLSKLARQNSNLSDQSDTEQEGLMFHEVQASKFQDPVTGEDVIMVIQTDVTQRVMTEQQLQRVLEAETRLLEEIFPRHVLEVMTHHTSQHNVVDHHAAARSRRVSRASSIDSAESMGTMGTTMSAGSSAPQQMSHLLRLQRVKRTLATHHKEVTVMFADVVGFTAMCNQVPAGDVMEFLNNLYIHFDTLTDLHGVYKVETIGDCYMVAGGLVTVDEQGFKAVQQEEVDPLHAKRCFRFAQAMLRVARSMRLPTGEPLQLRIGMNSGPVMSGVVGSKMPRFCLFGDTVNTASRMESTSQPNRIHASESSKALIGGDGWLPTGGVQVKGKGLMQTFLWKEPTHSRRSAKLPTVQLPAHTSPHPAMPQPPASPQQQQQQQQEHQPSSASLLTSGEVAAVEEQQQSSSSLSVVQQRLAVLQQLVVIDGPRLAGGAAGGGAGGGLLGGAAGRRRHSSTI